jgi:O-antigen ligase
MPGRDRSVDVLIAGSLLIAPLLPKGPTYLGLDWPWALEIFFLSVAALGFVLVAGRRRDASPDLGGGVAPSIRLVRRGYATWLIPLAAAMVIGLMARIPADWAFFTVEVEGLAGRLVRPMHLAAEPFYPLRVGLTCLEGGLAFWLLSAALRQTDQPRRRVHLALVGCGAGVILVSAIAIVQYLTRANLHAYWIRMNPDLTRAHATLDDPNALASFLVLGIGLAVGVAWSSERWTARRVVSALAALLAGVALMTTVSRAGWFALAISAVAIAATLPGAAFASRARVRLVRMAGRGVTVFAVTALLLWSLALTVTPKHVDLAAPETPWQALVQTLDPRESVDRMLKGRLLLWRASLDFAREHPVLGLGLGQFPRLYASYPGSHGAENTHNFFLQVLAEAGLIGLAGLCTLLMSIGVAVVGFRRGLSRSRARLLVGLALGIQAFVLTWMTGHPLLTLSNQLWLASVLAVGLAAAVLS